MRERSSAVCGAKQVHTNSVGIQWRRSEYPGGLERLTGLLAEPLSQTGRFANTAHRRPAPMRERSGTVCGATTGAYEHCWRVMALVRVSCGLGNTAGIAG